MAHAANPVRGVNMTFDTTLTEISPDQGGPPGNGAAVIEDGDPILLGSSEPTADVAEVDAPAILEARRF
jgi:hypothetical protein